MPARAIRIDDLVGTWRLTEYLIRDVAGGTNHPLGPSPVGLLIYAADGHTAGHMARADRPAFAVPRTEAVDRSTGTDAEIRQAFDSYFGYAGRYRLDAAGRVVCHEVELCLVPGWAGRTLVREMDLDDARTTLRLTTAPRVVAGVEQRAHLTWVRPHLLG